MCYNKHLIIFILFFFGILSCQKTVAPETENYEYTYNFKVRIYDSYTYNNPVNVLWGSRALDGNTLKIKADFDERVFNINDYTRSENFVYGGDSEIWRGDSFESTGIRVEWPSNDDTLSFDFSVKETDDFRGYQSTKTIISGDYGNNFGVNATVDQKSVEKAAFIINYPDKFPGSQTSEVLGKVDSIEIKHPNGNWLKFTDTESCFEELQSGRGEEFHSFVMVENLPLDAILEIKLTNNNGLNHIIEREIGIVPFTSQFGLSSNTCKEWETYINEIYLTRTELVEDFVQATQQLRTVDFFPLPVVGDTLKFIHTRNEEQAGTVEYDFFLLPIEISTNPDTTITFERHITWIPSGFGGERLDEAEIDTVTLAIQNRKFQSLDIFPEVESSANGLHTYYPNDVENPHTEKIYIEPDTGEPPFNSTFITLSIDEGITKITRHIQYSYNSSGSLYYTYTLVN